ncbi:MAG: tetratricopeptide repeat protein [candidate division Zixibacteria bacterium]|nr:tetratricopeptide repeat protein [candidate division Zixibacteria bacterium]
MLKRLISGCFITLAFYVSLSATPSDQFTQANRFYEQRAYDSAVFVYRQLVSEGMESAPLYFNLGNAYFRSGDLGQAVLCYLRAKRLDPADPDIKANLEFARQYTSVQMEGVRLNPVGSLFESIVEPYRLSMLAWISSGFFILLFAFFIARFGFAIRGALIKVGIWLTFLLLFSASLLTTVKYDHDFLTRRGVIVAEECVVRTGPSEQADKELDASPGLIVEILDQSGDFYNVLFENQRRGWVRKDLLAVV